jgi:chromatin remodeling complex protein RSC6
MVGVFIQVIIMPLAKKTTSAPVTTAAKPAAATPTPKATPAKAAEKPAAVAVPEPVVAAEPAPPSPLDNLETKIGAIQSLLKELVAELKAAKKENDRMKKIVERTERKRANARSNPNGFAKPSKITEELCDFLAVPKGTEMSRTDVTRKVNAYIKEHNLNKPENKRIILPDAKLRKILGVKPEEEVSYFSLQKYLSRCFVKA